MAEPWELYGGGQSAGPVTLGTPRPPKAKVLTPEERMLQALEIKIKTQQLAKGARAPAVSLSIQDQKAINDMRKEIGDPSEIIRQMKTVAPVIDRFETGPTKAFAAEISTPREKDSGILDQAGALLFGNLTSDQDKKDYQDLQRFQNEFVLQQQIAQKGPQTESDALRMALTGISPGKRPSVNAGVVGDTLLKARLLQRRPEFYTQWAQQHGGVNAVDDEGKTVGQAWQEFADRAYTNYRQNIANIQREKQQGGAASQGGFTVRRIK